MQVTITIPQSVIDQFGDTFEDLVGRRPTREEEKQFFDTDVESCYFAAFEDELENQVESMFFDLIED